MAPPQPDFLEVRLDGRDGTQRIQATEGLPLREELTRFLNRQGPYRQMWIQLASGEYVRYELITSVSLPQGER
jgi:hypothetical protein